MALLLAAALATEAAACGPECGSGTELCGGQCVRVDRDRLHCGGCDAACADDEVCEDGVCLLNCAGGTLRCAGKTGDVCIDTYTDPQNCGNCGVPCLLEQTCKSGACVLACVGGSTRCGDACVSLQKDHDHCGECGHVCPMSYVCVDGECSLECAGATHKCGLVCVNQSTDPENCGGCGVGCSDGEVCAGGVCDLQCVGGTTECLGGCHDLQTDLQHCGSCGNPCPSGLVCSAGTCDLQCGGGTIECNGGCHDLKSSTAHCGACNASCMGGEVCVQGQCKLLCVGGTTLCGGAGGSCRDLTNDPQNCGACGVTCSQGEVCSAGACKNAGGTVVSTGPMLGITIPDNAYNGSIGSMACASLNVPSGGAVKVGAVKVTVGITHAFVGDLTIKLVSPAGTVVTLLSRPGFAEAADNGGGCCGWGAELSSSWPITFADGVAVSAEQMGSGLGGGQIVCQVNGVCTFSPSAGAAAGGSLSSLNGQAVVGTWKLCAGDAELADAGSLQLVTLVIQ